jgi:hypothetical protein
MGLLPCRYATSTYGTKRTAQSADECLLLGVKRTWRGRVSMSANDPKQTRLIGLQLISGRQRTRRTFEDQPNTTPSMVDMKIAPAMEAFTSAYCPAFRAVSAITNSVRFPNVALSRPPAASPVLAATDSVARLRSTANGTMASTERRKRIVCASGEAFWTMKTMGTTASSQSNGCWRTSLRRRCISSLFFASSFEWFCPHYHALLRMRLFFQMRLSFVVVGR